MTDTNSAETFEGWGPVPGYEGIYEVSNQGRVARDGRILKPLEAATGGYLSIQLWRGGKPKMHLIHRLVAAAFIGPCPRDQEVNHCDGNKRCNAVGNLEYVTRSGNSRHAYRIGLRHVSDEQINAMAHARRKPRIVIPCSCGCGAQIETPDKKGRDRRFLSGHNMNAPAKGRMSNG